MKIFISGAITLLLEWFCMLWWWSAPTYLAFWPVHILFMGVVYGLVSGIGDAGGEDGQLSGSTTFGIVVAIIGLLLWIVLGLFGSTSFTRADAFRDLGNVTVSDKPLDIADVRHIRIVPKESAAWIGNQIIGKGNLGAQFVVENYYIQRVNGGLYWVAPLEFRGFWAWRQTNYTSPGYIMVSAEDVNAPPKLVDNRKMVYTLGAWWGNNVYRHTYFNGYMGASLGEAVFEIDDTGKPYYVIPVRQPQICMGGMKMTEVAILDPETGDVKPYTADKLPKWVDRAFPEDMAKDYAHYWGRYTHGWLNASFGQKDVQELSRVESDSKKEKEDEETNTLQDIFLVYNKLEDRPIWVTGMTSPSRKDAALTGYMTADSINGKMIFYPVTGVGNEQAVINAVEAAPEVAIQKNYHAAQPILYRIYDTDTWVVPVLSPSHIVEKVAVVYGPDLRHVSIGRTKEEALDGYKDLLAEVKQTGFVPTELKTVEELTGKVTRISWDLVEGKSRYYILVDSHPNQIFEITKAVSSVVAITKVGDRVALTYFDNGEDTVAVKNFNNLEIKLTKSQPQKEHEAAVKTRNDKVVKDLEAKKKELAKQQAELDKQLKDSK
jgi:hypothetical protein